jgi:hypothetical protein
MCRKLWHIRWSCKWCDGTFKDFTKTSSKSFIWIEFYSSKIGNKTRNKNLQIYKQFLIINSEWTPIEKKITKVQVGSNPSHIITRIQFPIQLVVACAIQCVHGLTLDCLTFDPTSVTKHGLTYTPLSHICSKEHLYLLSWLTNKTFQVDTLVQEEIHWLRTTAWYELTLIFLKFYCTKFVIIESLNTCSLTLHFQNIIVDQNLLAFHILCLNEMKIKNIHTNQEAYNVISQRITFYHVMTNMEQSCSMII